MVRTSIVIALVMNPRGSEGRYLLRRGLGIATFLIPALIFAHVDSRGLLPSST